MEITKDTHPVATYEDVFEKVRRFAGENEFTPLDVRRAYEIGRACFASISEKFPPFKPEPGQIVLSCDSPDEDPPPKSMQEVFNRARDLAAYLGLTPQELKALFNFGVISLSKIRSFEQGHAGLKEHPSLVNPQSWFATGGWDANRAQDGEQKVAPAEFGKRVGEIASMASPGDRVQVNVINPDMEKVAVASPGDTLVIAMNKPIVGQELRNTWFKYAERLRSEFGLKVVILEDVLRVSVVKAGQQ